LIQAAESEEKYIHQNFVPALARVIKAIQLHKIPEFVLKLYDKFFLSYNTAHLDNV
jgi:hypothetical protein